jgi:hypothetical protein
MYLSPAATPFRKHRVDALEIARGQRHAERADVVLEVHDARGSRDRDDVVALMEQPREGELRGGASLPRCDVLDVADEVEVLLEVLPLKARLTTAEVVGREVLEAGEAAGEKSAAERAVGDEADAELAAGREDLVLDVAHPERVLGLQRGDRVDGLRAADRGAAASLRPR